MMQCHAWVLITAQVDIITIDLFIFNTTRWWFQNILYFCPYLGRWSNLTNVFWNAGSTIRTLLHGKINPKDWQVLSLGDVGFLLFFRVVSGDYGKPWNGLKPSTRPVFLRQLPLLFVSRCEILPISPPTTAWCFLWQTQSASQTERLLRIHKCLPK